MIELLLLSEVWWSVFINILLSQFHDNQFTGLNTVNTLELVKVINQSLETVEENIKISKVYNNPVFLQVPKDRFSIL